MKESILKYKYDVKSSNFGNIARHMSIVYKAFLSVI